MRSTRRFRISSGNFQSRLVIFLCFVSQDKRLSSFHHLSHNNEFTIFKCSQHHFQMHPKSDSGLFLGTLNNRGVKYWVHKPCECKVLLCEVIDAIY